MKITMLKMMLRHWTQQSESVPGMGTFKTTVCLYGLETIAFTFNGRLTRKRALELVWRELVDQRCPLFVAALRNVK